MDDEERREERNRLVDRLTELNASIIEAEDEVVEANCELDYRLCRLSDLEIEHDAVLDSIRKARLSKETDSGE